MQEVVMGQALTAIRINRLLLALAFTAAAKQGNQ
jgi:hypothetical protein